MRSITRPCPPARATTGHLAYGRSITRTTTVRSCWIRTDTTSKRSVIARSEVLASPSRTRERTVERVRERLLLARAVGRVATRLHSGPAQAVHEVPNGQPLADALG